MDDQENSNINGNKLWKTIEESRETDFVNSTLNSSSAANDDREIHSTLTGATLPNSIDNPQHNISTPLIHHVVLLNHNLLHQQHLTTKQVPVL